MIRLISLESQNVEFRNLYFTYLAIFCGDYLVVNGAGDGMYPTKKYCLTLSHWQLTSLLQTIHVFSGHKGHLGIVFHFKKIARISAVSKNAFAHVFQLIFFHVFLQVFQG